ncbi:hypothetical protein QJQ45_003944 [Haematococcus lacustris]|nr:hypothetical protein QJQ45_003944 [Haematococcus lacustris]
MLHQVSLPKASTVGINAAARRLGGPCRAVKSNSAASGWDDAYAPTSFAGPSTRRSWLAQTATQWAAVAMSAVVVLGTVTGEASALSEDKAVSAVEEYIALDSKGKFNEKGGSKALDDFRSKYNLKRTGDGRLQLRSANGDWYQCRLDMEVPGTMLLRDSKGFVFGLQTDVLQQVDLSDDMVVLMMFGAGEWQKQMAPIEYEDESGNVKQLQMADDEFRQVVGILKDFIDDASSGQQKKK